MERLIDLAHWSKLWILPQKKIRFISTVGSTEYIQKCTAPLCLKITNVLILKTVKTIVLSARAKYKY